MEFRNINRTHELENWSLCLVKLKNKKVWDYTGYSLAVYLDGEFYDSMLFEQGEVDLEDSLTKHVREYLYLGEKLTWRGV